MEDALSDLATAAIHMRTALAILDRSGEKTAAIHLQQAIEIIAKTPSPQTVEEWDAMVEDLERRGCLPD